MTEEINKIKVSTVKAQIARVVGDFAATGQINDSKSRVPLNITSVIVDREQGASMVDDIWGSEANVAFVSHYMRKTKNARESIAGFFLKNGMVEVFSKIIDSKTFRTGGYQASKAEVIQICEDTCGSKDDAVIIGELCLPMLIAAGLVSPVSKYAVRRKVGYQAVGVAEIASDILGQEVARALKEAHARFVLPAGTHSTRAVAEQFGDIFRSIGIALYNINDYESVLDDIVLGVLANIDPAPMQTQRGTVPEYIERHSVVLQLSGCWNFVREALVKRAEVSGIDGPSTGIRVNSDAWKFDKWAPVILTMIRNSARYQMISKNEFVAFIGTKRVFDLEGKPAAVIVYDNAVLEAAAMAVTAVEDLATPGALNLAELPDRVSERISLAYDKITSVMTVETAVTQLHDILQMAVECGSRVKPLYVARFTSSELHMDLTTVAAMMADRVSARFGMDDDRSAYTLVFSGSTDVKSFQFKSGGMIAGEFYTTDPVEYFLVSQDVDARQTYAVPPQLIPRTAMRSRIVGYERETDFIKTTERMGYKMDVLGVSVTGMVKLRELTSIRMGDMTSLVCPHHNNLVYQIIDDVLVVAYDIANSIKHDAVRRRALRNIGAYVLKASQAISAGFRSEVHGAITERAAENLPYSKSLEMRAKLRQQALSAFADVISATIFLKMQGIAERNTVFDDMIKDELVFQQWIEVGSDR